MSAPWDDVHWLDEKAQLGVRTNYVKLRLDALFDAPLITLDELARPPFGRFRWAVRQSGVRMPSSIADALEPWWEARVADARQMSAAAARRGTGARPGRTSA